MKAFIVEGKEKFYQNSLTFEDKEQVHIEGNFYKAQFSTVFISIDACNSNFYHAQCASAEEIDKFMGINEIYFAKQGTIVNRDMYSNSDNIDESFSDSGKPEAYYPL